MDWSQRLWLTLAAAACRRRLEETVAGWLHPPAVAIRCVAGRSGPAAVTLIAGWKTACWPLSYKPNRTNCPLGDHSSLFFHTITNFLRLTFYMYRLSTCAMMYTSMNLRDTDVRILT